MNKVWLLTKTSLRNQFDLNRWFWESRRRSAEPQLCANTKASSLRAGVPPDAAAGAPTSVGLNASHTTAHPGNAVAPKPTKVGAPRSSRLKLVLAALVIGVGTTGIFGLFFFYSWMLGGPLEKFGLLRVLVLYAVLFPSMVSFLTSLYTVPGQLFYSKDYDLLLSLPLKTTTVLMSKLLNLLLANSLVAAVLALPPLIVYGWKSGAGPAFWLCTVVAVPLLPAVPLTGAALLALLTGNVAGRFKRSSQVVARLTLILLILLMVGSFQLSGSSQAAMAGANAVLDAIRTWYPPAALCFDALTGPSLVSLLLFLALSAGVLLLFCVFFARSFRTILSRLGATCARADYKLQPLAASSPLWALFVKEVKGYFGCPIYVLNTSVGMVMLTLFSVSTLCLGDATKAKLFHTPGLVEWAPVSALLTMVFLASICCTTASSISLEGRSLWILKSAPLDPLAIFKGKLLLNLAVTWPFLALNSLLLMAGLRLDCRHWLLIWGVSSVYALFMAVAGLVINLLYPKLEFKNPVAVVKQSASVLITVAVGLAAVVAPVTLYNRLHLARVPYELYAILTAAALLGLTGLLWLVLRTKGIGWFQRLN